MNKGISGALIGVAVLLVIFGLANHFALHLNPVAHMSSIIAGLAVLFAIIGGVGFMMKPKAAV